MKKSVLILFVLFSTVTLGQVIDRGNHPIDKKHRFTTYRTNASSFLEKWKFTIDPGIVNIDFTDKNMGWSNNFRVNKQKRTVRGEFDFYDSRKNFFKFDQGDLSDQANHYLLTVEHQISGFTITGGVMHDKAELDDGRIQYRKGFGGQNIILLFGYSHSFPLNENRLSIDVYGRMGGYISNDNIWLNIPISDDKLIYRHLPRIGYRSISGGGFASQFGVEYTATTHSGFGISLGTLIHFQMGKSSTMAPVINPKNLSKSFDFEQSHKPRDIDPSILKETKVSVLYGMASVGFYINFNLGK